MQYISIEILRCFTFLKKVRYKVQISNSIDKKYIRVFKDKSSAITWVKNNKDNIIDIAVNKLKNIIYKEQL